MPSVLIEVGFLTNPKEELYLITNEGQEYIASAIYRAFKDYKRIIEEKSHFNTVVDTPITKPITEPVISKEVIDSPVQFKVQIASARNSIDTSSDYFKGLTNIEEHKFDNIYKYTVGSSGNYNDMVEFKKTIEDKFPGAFIIEIEKSGIQIPLSEAFKIVNK
jgi:N-acetylmuramoyl-L-alanine amidase